jgi:DNA replication protein DnaC
MMTENINSKIVEYTKELKLPGVRKHFQDTLVAASGAELGYDEYLLLLLEKEYELRLENRKKSRLRLAGFPYKKYLDDLELESLPEDARKKLHVFKSLDFIRTGQNIILAGNPGTGKTHLAVGLGIKACMAGYKVLFTRVPT